MYDIKRVIDKIKQIANLKSNADLARLLNISYNTLNTWIKRGKLPQEVLISFCKEYKCSLDYLLLEYINKDNTTSTLFSSKEDKENIYTFNYYGKIYNYEENNKYLELTINNKIIHSNHYYLLNKENIYIVAICKFDIFEDIVYIQSQTKEHKVTLNNFYKINRGLITDIKEIKF